MTSIEISPIDVKTEKKEKKLRDLESEIKRLAEIVKEQERKSQIPQIPQIQQIPQKNPLYKPRRMNIFIKMGIYILTFVFFVVVSYLLLSLMFKTSFLEKAMFSLGVGIAITLIFSFIWWIYNKFSKKGSDVQSGTDYDLEEIRLCPLCNQKILKSGVVNDGARISQYFKCANPMCDWKKNVNFTLNA